MYALTNDQRTAIAIRHCIKFLWERNMMGTVEICGIPVTIQEMCSWINNRLAYMEIEKECVPKEGEGRYKEWKNILFPIDLLKSEELEIALILYRDKPHEAVRYIRSKHPEIDLRTARIYYDLYIKDHKPQKEDLELAASDYAINHYEADKTYSSLEVHKMLCDAFIAGVNLNLDTKDN